MGDILVAARRTAGNPMLEQTVWQRHYDWLEMTEDEQFAAITPEAADFARDWFLGRFRRPRAGRFSLSGLGGCQRALLFGFAGVPKLGEDPARVELASMGTHDHVFWQVEGLSMGWLKLVERFVLDPRTMVGGSIDGIQPDDSIFELKTVTSAKFGKVFDGPFWEHLIQADGYGELWGSDYISIVYQDRQYGNFREHRVERDDKTNKARLAIEAKLNDHVASDTLPPVLSGCDTRSSMTYKQCPYRKYCLTATKVMLEER
jgi:hypothetical protein